MAKRFTDRNKWTDPFLRGLQGPYKLLWLYLKDECDHAGIWAVDMEVAAIRIGCQDITLDAAMRLFKGKIIIIDNGNKWFLPEFIEEQYGELNPQNRVHDSVLKLLKKYGLEKKSGSEFIQNKPHVSPLQGAKYKDKDKEKEKDKAKDNAHARYNGATPAPAEPKSDVWQQWVDSWFEFYEGRTTVKPAFNSVQAAALKRIRTHLEAIAAQQDGGEFTGLMIWKNILYRWDDLDPWLRTQFDLTVVAKKINTIIETLRNGTAKKSNSAQVSTASAFSKIDRITGTH